jgi:Zn-dependent protease
MDSSFELGQVAGIRIGINWSWIAVFALIVWTLATGIFPDQNPGYSDGAYVAMAVVAAVAFFASLLAHELGHALQARREGMEIDGITLWLFGGVARFKGSFPSAGGEFRIAIAGPLVSLAIGVACVLVARASLPDALDGVVSWLGYINLTLLVFNLLPALPLDGGRVLRSALWKARGDFRAATRVASGISRVIGYAMIGGGILLFIFEGAFSGAWLAFIGWFLLAAAAAEERAILTRDALAGLQVGDVMVRRPVTVEPELTLGQFLDEVVAARRFTTYPVVRNGEPLGLLPFRCVAQVPRAEWDEKTVGDCMLPLSQVTVFSPREDLAAALERLAETEPRRGLVVEEGRLAGLLSISDLGRLLELRLPDGSPPARR